MRTKPPLRSYEFEAAEFHVFSVGAGIAKARPFGLFLRGAFGKGVERFLFSRDIPFAYERVVV